MGTDIRLIVEYKTPSMDHWEFFDNVDIERDYHVFAVLADVRNDYDMHLIPISEPRGLPEDVHYYTRDLLEEHYSSLSWISWNEFVERWPDEVRQSSADLRSGYYSQFCQGIYQIRDCVKPEDTELRLVFGFDS